MTEAALAPSAGPQGPALDLTIVGALREAAQRRPDRLFATFEGRPLDFGNLDRMSDRLAAGLLDRGLSRGDRVAVMLPNSLDLIVLVFALMKAGLVWVPVNPTQRGDSLRSILETSEPALAVLAPEAVPQLRGCGAPMPPQGVVLALAQGGLSQLAAGKEGAAVLSERPRPADVAAMMFTSGTTGAPKGVLVTHRMLALSGEAAGQVADIRTGDVLFVWEPLFHIGGAQLLVLPLIEDVRLHMVGRFSASRFWDQVAEAGATQIHYLGGILQILLAQTPAPKERAHGVRLAWGAGCPPAILPEIRARFGLEIRECYGMTEASSVTTFTGDADGRSVGRPMPWFEVEIHDSEDRILPPGARGEIVVKPLIEGALFPRYFRRPEATAETLRNGRLYTGDLGALDEEGNLGFLGRLKDSVRCRGENVSAWEVEHVVANHPDVEEAAIVGVPAEIGEEDIKLFVSLAPGRADFDPQALTDWLAPRLAPHMMPRYLVRIDRFSRTVSQRIIKTDLPRTTGECWDRLSDGRQSRNREAGV